MLSRSEYIFLIKIFVLSEVLMLIIWFNSELKINLMETFMLSMAMTTTAKAIYDIKYQPKSLFLEKYDIKKRQKLRYIPLFIMSIIDIALIYGIYRFKL